MRCTLGFLGALYLKALDDRMAETGLFYARFMDDWVILAPTRWKLRRAIKAVNLGAGGAEGGAAPGQDLHRAFQPGGCLFGVCVFAVGRGGEDGGTVCRAGDPAL